LNAAVRLFTLVKILVTNVLIVTVHIVHVLHRLARLLEAHGKPFAVEVGVARSASGPFFIVARFSALSFALGRFDNRKNVFLCGAVK
jgi:hypothetical protein